MPRLDWGVPRTRTIETGVDRGVLYIEGSTSGVAWSGLTKIERSLPEASLESVYHEGYLANLRRTLSPVTFRIDTISTPTEFQACLGRAELAPGFFIDNQPLKSFGFTYRTRIANDLVGTEHGYKIHIVFQAYASEQPIIRQTVSSNPSVTSRTYNIQTIPIVEEGFKPMSYISINSMHVNPGNLNDLENILYGTDSTEPTLPTFQQIIDAIP